MPAPARTWTDRTRSHCAMGRLQLSFPILFGSDFPDSSARGSPTARPSPCWQPVRAGNVQRLKVIHGHGVRRDSEPVSVIYLGLPLGLRPFMASKNSAGANQHTLRKGKGPARRPALLPCQKTPASRRNAHCFGLFFATDKGRTCRPILLSLRAAWHRIGAAASANAPHVLRHSRHRRPPGSWR